MAILAPIKYFEISLVTTNSVSILVSYHSMLPLQNYIKKVWIIERKVVGDSCVQKELLCFLFKEVLDIEKYILFKKSMFSEIAKSTLLKNCTFHRSFFVSSMVLKDVFTQLLHKFFTYFVAFKNAVCKHVPNISFWCYWTAVYIQKCFMEGVSLPSFRLRIILRKLSFLFFQELNSS